MHGFYGRILIADLTARTSTIEAVPDRVLARTLGGKGLATWLLLRDNPVGVDPLGPDNRLIFATGPFCQSSVWGGSRYGVFTRSPQTGFYSESYSGGKVPEAIDATGFDAIVLTGASDSPVVVRVTPSGAEFLDARELWGMETYDAERAVLERFAVPDAKERGYRHPGAAVIGPAGEKLVPCALIANDLWRCAGRTGVGAVMGSKKVKGVLFQGDHKRAFADPEAVKTLAREFLKKFKDAPATRAYKAQGTTMMVAIMNTAGAFPNRYWQSGQMEGWEKISGEAIHKKFDVTPHACLKCFMACGRMSRVKEGRHAGLTIEGPEYETIYSFGGLCLIDEPEEIAHLNDLCDRLGIDTITAGNLCGLAIEARRAGKLDFAIDYGDAAAVAELVRLIAAREGVGALFSQGIVAAAETLGVPELAVHVKGMEPAGYDPRALKGMGLAYGTSPRGACHLRATFYKPELAGMIPPDTVEGKAELFTDFEDRLTLFDTLILCRFYRDFYDWETLGKFIQATTGVPGDKEHLRALAADVLDMTRRFNLLQGLTPADDRLPARLHREKLPSGKSLGADEMEYMLADYYRLRQWDAQGVPQRPGVPI